MEDDMNKYDIGWADRKEKEEKGHYFFVFNIIAVLMTLFLFLVVLGNF